MVLGLLWSGNSYAEIIMLKCTEQKTYIGLKETNSSSKGKVDIMNINSDDENQIITKNRFISLYTYPLGGGKFTRGIGLEIIDRVTGEFRFKTIEGTEEDAKKFRNKFVKVKKSLKRLNTNMDLVQLLFDFNNKYMDQASDKRTYNYKVIKNCEKAKNKF